MPLFQAQRPIKARLWYSHPPSPFLHAVPFSPLLALSPNSPSNPLIHRCCNDSLKAPLLSQPLQGSLWNVPKQKGSVTTLPLSSKSSQIGPPALRRPLLEKQEEKRERERKTKEHPGQSNKGKTKKKEKSSKLSVALDLRKRNPPQRPQLPFPNLLSR